MLILSAVGECKPTTHVGVPRVKTLDLRHGGLLSSSLAVSLFGLRSPFLRPGPRLRMAGARRVGQRRARFAPARKGLSLTDRAPRYAWKRVGTVGLGVRAGYADPIVANPVAWTCGLTSAAAMAEVIGPPLPLLEGAYCSKLRSNVRLSRVLRA